MHNDCTGAHAPMSDEPGPAKADGTGAAYEADDGPLSDAALAELRRIASSRLPKSPVVSHQTPEWRRLRPSTPGDELKLLPA